MTCRICGSEQDVKFYDGRRGALCASCAKDTPAKVSRAAFYEDYRASGFSLKAYIAKTVSAV